jgi:hypothetical protein
MNRLKDNTYLNKAAFILLQAVIYYLSFLIIRIPAFIIQDIQEEILAWTIFMTCLALAALIGFLIFAIARKMGKNIENTFIRIIFICFFIFCASMIFMHATGPKFWIISIK